MADGVESPRLSKGAEKALHLFEESLGSHTRFRDRVDARYRGYMAEIESRSDADSWTSKLSPPLARHIVETTLSGLVDDRFAFKVKPMPRFYDGPEEWDKAVEGARAHEILAKFQLRQDGFNRKLRPFALQQSIAEYTVMKTFWQNDKRQTKRLELSMDGGQLALVEKTATRAGYAGPCSEVCDVRDWGCHEATFDLARSSFVWHRVWMSYEELLEEQRQGRYSNVSDLSASREFSQEATQQRHRGDKSRTKDKIEVLEIWYRAESGIRVVVLGNRKVELRADRENPFWHGQYPFVVASTQPGLFELGGMPQMEMIKDLQEAHWDLFNQSLDGTHLLNNPVFAMNMAVEDPDAYDFYPGARWPVEGKPEDSVAMMRFDGSVPEIAAPWLSRIEQHMQNLAGSQPFTSTSEGQINAQTATEASLVTNLATRSVMAQKAQLYHAYQQIGQQRMELSQQFIRMPVMAEQIGVDNEQELVSIGPLLLQGDYLFDIEPMNESLFASERKAQAQGVLQMMMQVAPLAAAMSQAGVGHAVNIDKAIEDYLKSQDIQDPSAYFISKPAPAPPTGQPGQPGQQNGGPGGVTAPQSIAPETSPSNQASISPEVLNQRAAAMSGGANGGGAYGG